MTAATYITDWMDAEINRLVLRESLFQRRDLTQEQAERLAERCLERERETGWKDMHACVECKHWQRGGRCAATGLATFPKTLMHRCDRFEWQVPRQEISQ